MTDSLRGSVKGGMGDPNFHKHSKIDSELGEVWRTIRLSRPLSDATQRVAAQFGYELPHECADPVTVAAIDDIEEGSL